MSKSDTNSDYLFLKIGALLHDIGHVVPAPEGEAKGHAERGFEFLSSFANTEGFSAFAKYHHARSVDEIVEEGLSQKSRNLLWMVREASRLSSGNDGSDGEDAAGKHLLRSVFSGISGIKEEKEGKKFEVPIKYYPSVKLDSKAFVYPWLKEDLPALAEEGCGEIYKSFKDFFGKLLDLDENRINEDLLLMFLEQNTAFIPAGSGANNDISLFDHLKTTCAIASCMYRLHEKELEKDLVNEISDLKAENYLLIGGDVSGIQDFIYRISSKGAMRLLRGRSFYLEMFCEDIVHEIVERLGLPKTNILYSGGGNFYILAPNTEDAKNKLKEIENDLYGIENNLEGKGSEGWLIANGLSSSLYVALSCIPFCGKKFENFSKIWMDINQKNSLKKAQKYQSALEKNPSKILELGDKGDPCDACRKRTPYKDLESVDEEDVAFCPLCREQMKIGSELARLGDSFYILKTKYRGEGFSIPFSTMKIMDKETMGTVSKSSSVYAVNNFDTGEIINLMKSKKIPPDIHVSSLPIAIYCAKSDEKETDRQLLTFEQLADKSEGSKKLGAVRMDVDNLGKIFTLGLPDNRRTITRISSLSRMMNYFFKGYLNFLGEFDEENVLDVCNWQSNSPNLVKSRDPSRNISIVYAGGDDLFILGAWDDVFELCFDIQGLFRKYVAENPHVTISAGFSIFNNKHPLYQIARVCGNKEECSKDEGRNRVYLLNRGVGKDHILETFKEIKDFEEIKDSLEWEDARKLFSNFEPFFWYIMKEKGNSSKTMVRKLLDAREMYCKDPEKANWVIQLHYFVSRNKDLKKILDKNNKLRKYFYSVPDEKVNPIYDIDLPLNILDLRGRKVN
ncbi:CRISPR-associated protein, Csm1 family [Methanosarcina sp. MTP4]|uniref:type III-A CRISPR-associated protein Cas10/Csm1 n=1 Tax=Methanosarcina sp. MTP4 TaxID=1434100 RepID=UPI000615A0DC|nr:type III-A CRISPR-associated protein Cas10/Csm1 [Methanosarcina sp. MTP4]AKB26316.1 CRISPR-associated protein, Csm1 family [Methanosarcina sp. MTP4]